MEKPIGTLLQAGAAYMFFAAGMFGGDALLLVVPAAVSGVAGLLLWGRGSRQSDPPVAADHSPEKLEQVNEAVASLQDEVSSLREDRDFLRNLYARELGDVAKAPQGASVTPPS